MNILVTGAAGFIGSHLCRRLHTHHNIYGTYLLRRPSHTAAYTYVRQNITDADAMLSLIVDREIDQVYHCAAKSVVRNCCRDPISCFFTNVMGTAAVLEACRRSGRVKGVMCMESDKSYGAGPVPYKEGQALRPGGIYEASKACAGHVAKSYAENYDLPVFTIRSANVYGPNDPNQSRLVPNTINRLRHGKQPQITAGARDFLREFIYVDDLLNAMVGLMDASLWGEAFNVGSGHTATVGGMVDCICSVMGKPFHPKIWDEPGDLLEIPSQELCLDKLRAALPDLPQPLSVGEGIRKTVKLSC